MKQIIKIESLSRIMIQRIHKIYSIILPSLLCILIISCEKEPYEDPIDGVNEEVTLTVDYDHKSSLKKDFSMALAKALENSLPLRALLKDEALKMFNKDYDVLYHFIKDEPLSDGNTVRDLLLNYYDDKSRLTAIEQAVPTLTIFVPQLPEDSFSAVSWNIHDEIPLVALRMQNTNNVPLFNAEGIEEVLPGYLIPNFPVVIVKENERVKLVNAAYKNATFSKIKDFRLGFIDDVFDGSKTTKSLKKKSLEADPKVKKAARIYQYINEGWQRDYVYYNITPSTTSGEFIYDYQEHLTTFKLSGDANITYQKLADQSGEPTVINGYEARHKPLSNWTGGFFEFKIKVLVNARNGIGSTIEKFFTLKPEDLFNLNYLTETRGGRGGRRVFYKFSSIEHNPEAVDINLPLFNWDLEQLSSSIVIEIEEIDLTETITLTSKRSTNFATNFSISGTIKKIGLEFGASRAVSKSQSINKRFTKGNDELGAVIVNFADKILDPWQERRRKYKTGYFTIGVEPRKVQ